MRRTFLVVALVGLAMCALACYNAETKLLLTEASAERWLFVGTGITHPGFPEERWVGTAQFREQTASRLVPSTLRPPGQEKTPGMFTDYVPYNEVSRVLIFGYRRLYDDGLRAVDVWRHDLDSGQSRWVGQKRWLDTRGYVWSPDGTKVAFVARTLDNWAATRPATVVQYDLTTDTVTELAGDALGGGDVIRQRRPVYSEEGDWMYYVSKDHRVVRLELKTGRQERLPFSQAIAVLTVKGGFLVYAKGDEWVGGRGPPKMKFQILKVKLDATSDLQAESLYCGMWLSWNYVSPSRRHILFHDLDGYGGSAYLLDVDTGQVSQSLDLQGQTIFWSASTVFVGPEKAGDQK